jgi:hypothetical protein
VRIERDRVGECEALERIARLGQARGRRPVGTVDVKPQVLAPADRRKRRERIDRAGADRARGADDEEG